MKKLTHLLTYTAIASALLLGSQTAFAMDTISSYTSTVYELDDMDTRNKKIRLVYSVQNIWNKSHIPNPIKEVKLLLAGGSGFDMTGVPKKSTVHSAPNAADYLYSIPTAFQVRVDYNSGSAVRHLSHTPSNSISSDSVAETSSFNLGITAGSDPTITGGATYSSSVRYNQKEFDTIVDYNNSSQRVTWDIINKTVQHSTDIKNNLIYRYTSCGTGINNLININDLPLVMRSDFKPESSIVFRKLLTTPGERDTTNFGFGASWTKSDYYIAQDICSFHTNFVWKPFEHQDKKVVTVANRIHAISWNDSLYH